MGVKILVTGDRNWDDYLVLYNALHRWCGFFGWDHVEFVEGDCTGADRMAGTFAHETNVPVAVFPARWELHGKKAGPIRNRQMMDYCVNSNGPTLVIAFHDNLVESRGTGDMVRVALRAGVPVLHLMSHDPV